MEIVIGKNLNCVVRAGSISDDVTYFIPDTSIRIDNLYIAENDGKIYTDEGMLTYKKGQIIGTLCSWLSGMYVTRIVVFDSDTLKEVLDNATKDAKEVRAKLNSKVKADLAETSTASTVISATTIEQAYGNETL